MLERFSLCHLPLDPSQADEETASEKIPEEDKREVPLQEEQTEESGESNDPRGEAPPEEKYSSCPPPGRSHRLESCLVAMGNSAECK